MGDPPKGRAGTPHALTPNQAYLVALAKTRMPFGRYAGRRLIDLPEPYVVWFKQKGFPHGELGKKLQIIYEMKVNGLEHLFDPWKNSP